MAAVAPASTQRGDPADQRARPTTRERIIGAAAEVFAEKGYRRSAVDDIVGRSGTSKGSFYHFFPSKEGIFLAVLERLGSLLLERVSGDVERTSGALDRVGAALGAALSLLEEHRTLARILVVEAPALGHGFDARLFALHRRFAGFIASRLDDAVREGDIPPLDTELAAYAWLGAVHEIVLRWLHVGQGERLTDAVPELRRLLLRSIGARA